MDAKLQFSNERGMHIKKKYLSRFELNNAQFSFPGRNKCININTHIDSEQDFSKSCLGNGAANFTGSF